MTPTPPAVRPPHAHIQFVAGEIEPDISDRVSGGRSASATAQRDLERYYRILRDEVARVRLSELEAMTIAVAYRKFAMEYSSYRHVWIALENYLIAQVDSRAEEGFGQIPPLSAGGRAVLVGKIRTLSPGAAMAMGDAVERFWVLVSRAGPRADCLTVESLRALLKVAGLVHDA